MVKVIKISSKLECDTRSTLNHTVWSTLECDTKCAPIICAEADVSSPTFRSGAQWAKIN